MKSEKFLGGPGAAAGIALVNTIGATAGLVAPSLTGWLLDATGTSRAGLWVVSGVMAGALACLLVARSRVARVEALRVYTS